ncbi:MAG: DNA replication/repair protein RecF, partial [Acidimicrobiales bacterium]
DVLVRLGGRDSRAQASQGEQRCLALGLRLAAHRLLTDRLGRPPLLLLDDVFSELDPGRSRALLRELPPGQTFLSTASPVPTDMEVAMVIEMAAGR